jgi:toxin YoeB
MSRSHQAISQEPREGIGQPERLKHFNEETYSRRVNQEDRMIYVIYKGEKKVHISGCKFHYKK